jgi:steroid delta-isomerase-like uncharacterized protein
MTDTDANKKLVDVFIQALFTHGDLGAIDRHLAADFVDHDPPLGSGSDREAWRRMGAVFREAFPDWHSDVAELIAEGDLVTERFTARGTHQGELMGVPPTRREVALAGINVFRVRDGVITERWGRLDELGFLRQLGVIPSS